MNISLRVKDELEWERDKEDEETARDIRNLTEQKGERVPDKREALAMACLAREGKMAVGELGVCQDRWWFIILMSA